MNKTIKRREFSSVSIDSTLIPILNRVYAARGVSSNKELDYTLKNLCPPNFKGLDEAVSLLADAVVSEARVLIVGDFDADGATSSALAVLALRAFGLQTVDFLVPNRFEYGYGLTPEIVDVAAKDFQPDLIVTVDNGISSVEGVAAAQELGILVLVTDHHLPGRILPNAEAIVNPNQPGCDFPSKNLAGVGVIFYVMNALRAELRTIGWFAESGINEPNMAQFLDLVALGTVADVVPLDQNNRVLVAQGLSRIRAGLARPGILALLEIANRSKEGLVASDLGFAIGPRLNAAGRLDDMQVGIRCLLEDDAFVARDIAQSLDQLNQDRRAIEGGMQQEAMKMLQKFDVNDGADIPWGLCVYDADWHQGVIGILASRLKDRYHRPVIVFANAEDGSLKASARSIPGFHIRDALDAIATRQPALLQKFGGHAMAAGLSLEQEHFDAFSKAFDEEVRNTLSDTDLQAVLMSDGMLGEEHLTLNLAATLKNAGPWGQHFPEPLFDGVFTIVQQRIVGAKHLKLVLCLAASEQIIDAIAFNVDLDVWPNDKITMANIVYKLDVNEYRGKQSLQLMIEYIEPVS